MAATSDLVLKNFASANVTFTPSVAVTGGFQYADSSATPGSPRTLTVKHALLAANAANGTETHSLRFDHTVADSLGSMRTTSATLTFRIPRTGPNLANRRDIWSFVKDFLTDVNVEKLVLGGF